MENPGSTSVENRSISPSPLNRIAPISTILSRLLLSPVVSTSNAVKNSPRLKAAKAQSKDSMIQKKKEKVKEKKEER
jgi:hypothetical protein